MVFREEGAFILGSHYHYSLTFLGLGLLLLPLLPGIAARMLLGQPPIVLAVKIVISLQVAGLYLCYKNGGENCSRMLESSWALKVFLLCSSFVALRIAHRHAYFPFSGFNGVSSAVMINNKSRTV